MEIKIFKPQDHKIKTVIYWTSWAWKTVFWATAPNPIFASAEQGLLSVADKDIPYVDIKTIKDLKDLKDFLKNEKHNYQSIIIDSITEINEIIKSWIEEKNWRSMQLQDWGTLSKKIDSILRWFKDLDMHTIFIAQEQYIQDENKITKIVPSLNWKTATKIAYYMDIVWYISINKAWKRTLTTSANQKLLTKDRSNKIWNDTELDFSIWAKKIAQIKTSKEEVVSNFDVDKKNNELFNSLKVKLNNSTEHNLDKVWKEIVTHREELNDNQKKELKSIKGDLILKQIKPDPTPDEEWAKKDAEEKKKKEKSIEDDVMEIVEDIKKATPKISKENFLEAEIAQSEKEVAEMKAKETPLEDFVKLPKLTDEVFEKFSKISERFIVKWDLEETIKKAKEVIAKKYEFNEKDLDKKLNKLFEIKEFWEENFKEFKKVCKSYEVLNKDWKLDSKKSAQKALKWVEEEWYSINEYWTEKVTQLYLPF